MNPDVGSLPDNTLLTDNTIRFKVLVVDQPGPHLDDLVGALGEVGYNVDPASDSEATYRKSRSSVRPVALLIIDLESLQGVDALRFLKVLKKDECCTDTQLIMTIGGLLDERLVDLRGELAILPPRGHNLRASHRFPVKFLVHYAVGTNHHLFYASNLGLGGIFICNSQPAPVGTIAQLAFTLPGNRIRPCGSTCLGGGTFALPDVPSG